MDFIGYNDKKLDAGIVFTFEGAAISVISSIDSACFIASKDISALERFTGKKNDVTMVYGTQESPIPSIILIGLGAKDKYPSRCSLRKAIRDAAATAVRYARTQQMKIVAFLENSLQEEGYQGKIFKLYEDIAYAVEAGLYLFSMKTKEKDKNPEVYYCNASGTVPSIIEDAVALGKRLGNASTFVRDIVNGPANIVTPKYLLGKAEAIAKEHSLKLIVLDRKALIEKGLLAFSSVAQGSETEPYLIALEHCPLGKEKEAPIAIVGKGITFDTGGISIKPANNMHEMKADMGGAGTALGLATILKDCVEKRVVIVLACAENMPSGTASRPGDIVTTLSGKTVEILNTDAEGRLVLCDAITWVQNEFSPSMLIDMATLTGACVSALGEELTGLFTDDDELADDLLDAGRCAGQPLWRLPVLEDMFLEDVTSTIADLQNIGKSRYAGATTAAVFLKQFVNKDVRWAHLDIAGTAYSSIKNALTPGGATGAPLLALFKLLVGKCKKNAI